MNVLDLFSGIGGFSLGLDRAGMKTVAFCEIEKYPRTILKKHWPEVPIAQDVKKLSYNRKTLQLYYKWKVIYVGTIELVCGGFPCQPFSVAVKRDGKNDDRHLWPQMFRLIKEIKPDWIIGENVAGFISMALDDVLFDLESKAYGTQSFVIPACAVGGIHRRDRVWIVANSNNQRLQRKPLAGSNASKWQKPNVKQLAGRSYSQSYRPIQSPAEPPVRHRDDGISNNVARLKALGNAVVPQIPEIIGRGIIEIEKGESCS